MSSQEHLEKSVDYFSRMLYDSDDGADARAYLESRGLPLDELRPYDIGLCPADLLYPSSNELYLDGRCWFIRGRIVLPIRDQHGRILAFAGRILDSLESTVEEVLEEQLGDNPERLEQLMTKWRKSKWINEMYKKKRYLFNLDRAKRHIHERKNVILVEGYMDAIVLSMRGFEQVVAVQGGYFSKIQAALVKRYADHVTVCMDTDKNEAGQKATQRIIEVLDSVGMTHTVVAMPEGVDPDEALLNGGMNEAKLRWALERAADGRPPSEGGRAGTRIDLSDPNVESVIRARMAIKRS
jgi:DNA primase